MDLLTVGLPVYKSMPYLVETMESLLSQTSQQFKMLAIVQDKNDGSLEYLQSLRDARLRIIYQPEPSLIQALNRMLHEIDTPWLVRQDTDDISYPHRIENIIKMISKYPDAGMFYSMAEYYPRGKAMGTFRCTRGTAKQLTRYVKEGYLLSFCHSSVVLNAQKTLSVGGYRETAHLIEDADLWWRMALNFDIQFIRKKLIGYRHHTGQITSNTGHAQMEKICYIQYLLLSHLWSLEPQSWENVWPYLKTCISDSSAQAKDHLRMINVHLSSKSYSKAMKAALASFACSPTYVLGRVWDEIAPRRRIVNGIDPGFFAKHRKIIWASK